MLKKCLVFISLLAAPALCSPEIRAVNAEKFQFPFIVSLRNSTGHHICGGSIIAPSWILTAGHCVEGNPSGLSIQYSVLSLDENGPNVAPVKRFIVHGSYNPNYWYANDIALLELQGVMIFNNKSLAPVTLPEANFETAQVPEGEAGVLAVWGYNSTSGATQKNLQKANLKILSDEECRRQYHNGTTVHQICGGPSDSCSSDTGGPLLYQENIQLGIVSWSAKLCSIYHYPGIYTKVSHYVDWIDRNIRESDLKKEGKSEEQDVTISVYFTKATIIS